MARIQYLVSDQTQVPLRGILSYSRFIHGNNTKNMTIIQIHIEKTGGICLQDLYIKKYPEEKILWYNVRDDLFAPINIRTANYTKDWQLKPYAFVSRRLPMIRHLLIWIRTFLRMRNSVELNNIASQASVVIGHFPVNKLLDYLPPDQHEYRVVMRHPLNRMWSHFNYFMAHKGDVGHRVIPKYKQTMTFEEFALLQEMKNYQLGAMGNDLSIYKHIGITEKFDLFAQQAGLLDKNDTAPQVNSFHREMPEPSKEFLESFEKFHALDYELYNLVCKIVGT
jgi:hypothetical protein